MEFIQEVSAKLLEFGESIGGIAVAAPLSILAAIILLLFARFSYKLFKIVLPIAASLIVAIAGAEHLASVITSSFPEVEGQINPVLLSIIILAVTVLIVSIIFRKLAIILIGAGVCALVVPAVVFPAMRGNEFVGNVLVNLDMDTAVLFAGVFTVILTLVVIYVLYKFVNNVYVLATSVAASVAALAIPTVFLFASFSFAPTATFAAIVIGAMIGLWFTHRQMLTVR